jgi:hypothetical protein
LVDGFKHFFLKINVPDLIWISLFCKERISFSFAWFSSDRAWPEDASSPFSAVRSSIVKEKLGGDTA